MNKILIRCDGKDIILNTNRKISEVYKFVILNERNTLIPINSVTLEDESFKEEIIIKPTKVTLIQDITNNETIIPLDNKVGLDEFAKELIKKINKIQRNGSKTIYCV